MHDFLLEYKPEKGGGGGRVACERVGLSGTIRLACILFTSLSRLEMKRR